MKLGLVVASVAVVLLGCSSTQTESSAKSTTTLSDIALGGLDAKAQAYKDALLAAGIPASQPDSTTLAMVQGICRQISDGTPETEIVANLRPLADYAAMMSAGKLDGAQVAQLYLDTARATYC
jgi:ABC-type phosphate/phosphonate transport system substrate-binding protein